MTLKRSNEILNQDVTRFIPSRHAKLRMAQRNVPLNDIYFILIHGTRFHGRGAISVHLCTRDIPEALQSQKRFSRLVGTTVVLDRQNPNILTVYRNRQKGPRPLRKMCPYSRHKPQK